MSRVAPVTPDETTLLCESCGYILSGLPRNAFCPECGKAIVFSLPNTRRFSSWDRNCDPLSDRFWRTTSKVLFRPAHFYRALRTRCPKRLSKSFARIHLSITSALIGAAATAHVFGVFGLRSFAPWEWIVGGLSFTLATYSFLAGLSWLAARLTAWEAAYRGLRLPYDVVIRGLDYHSAHYLPVAVLAAATVLTQRLLLYNHILTARSDFTYLLVLCIEIVLSAIYLFITYWIGMKNMMYANA
jgi:predicted RNA-binding Zn-ribbon protein involved in translation (DUF1610 family)